MRIKIESTSKVVDLVCNGVAIKARIWEGETDSGIPVHCYVTRIAVAEDADQSQFQQELSEQRTPSAAIQAIPLRLIL
jgi:hypothetical protein